MDSPADGPVGGPATGAVDERPARPVMPPRQRLGGIFTLALVIVSWAAHQGLWWMPFLAGVLAGLVPLRWPDLRPGRVVLATLLGAVAGWALPLWILALAGYPAGATARVIAALAGLPPYALVTVVVTLLLAALQVLAGAWLARAVTPRRG
jgi:hypothetical protein